MADGETERKSGSKIKVNQLSGLSLGDQNRGQGRVPGLVYGGSAGRAAQARRQVGLEWIREALSLIKPMRLSL